MAGARGHRRCHQALSCQRVQPTGVLTQHPTRGSTRGGSGRGCCAGTPADRILGRNVLPRSMRQDSHGTPEL